MSGVGPPKSSTPPAALTVSWRSRITLPSRHTTSTTPENDDAWAERRA